MGLFWRDCFLCFAQGKLLIGDNFNKFHKPKEEDCPICHGSRRVAMRDSYSDSFKNRLWGIK